MGKKRGQYKLRAEKLSMILSAHAVGGGLSEDLFPDRLSHYKSYWTVDELLARLEREGLA